MSGIWAGWLDSLGALDHMHLSSGHSDAGGRFQGGIVTAGTLRRTANPPQHQNVWVGLGVMAPEAKGRGKADDVVRLLGVWADLDAKPGGCGDMATCAAVVADVEAALNCEATYVVMSGHGLQPVWAVKADGTPVTEQKALLKRFGDLVVAVAADHGGKVDSVFDPARILRAPGTVNHKDPENPVPVEYRNGGAQRLTWTELKDVLDGRGVAMATIAASGPAVPLDPDWWTEGEPCKAVSNALDEMLARLKGERHPTIIRAQQKLARLGEQGHQGTAEALDALGKAFVASVTADGSRSPSEAEREWFQALDGVVLTGSTPALDKGCCVGGIDVEAILAAAVDIGPGTAPGTDDAEQVLSFEVAKEVQRLRVRELAKQQLADEQADEQVLPDAMDWDDLDAAPDPQWAIEEVLPEQGHTLFVAQAKAGKSTMVGGLVRSVTTGQRFLNEFTVHCKGSSVQVLDLELGPSQLKRYYRDSFHKGDPVAIRPLRGRLGAMNLLSDRSFDRLVTAVTGTDLLIIDPLGPLLAACGTEENDNSGVRQVLNALNALQVEAGVARLMVVHHFGHSGERARGASVLQDWRDQQWKITLDDPANPATSGRYFGADGRDGAPVPDRLLRLDAAGVPYLDLSTKGSAKAAAKRRQYEERVLTAVDDHSDPLARKELVLAVGGSKQPVLEAINSLVRDGFLEEFYPAGTTVKHLRRA